MGETTFKTTRYSAGNYAVTSVGTAREYVVDIGFRDDLKGWIAAARWDRHLYSDPVPTFREAKQSAVSQIEGALAEHRQRSAATP